MDSIIDRIDNNKPHDRENVLISCYYYNCRDHKKFDQKNKICKTGCHKILKHLRLINNVLKSKIHELLLKK